MPNRRERDLHAGSSLEVSPLHVVLLVRKPPHHAKVGPRRGGRRVIRRTPNSH